MAVWKRDEPVTDCVCVCVSHEVREVTAISRRTRSHILLLLLLLPRSMKDSRIDTDSLVLSGLQESRQWRFRGDRR